MYVKLHSGACFYPPPAKLKDIALKPAICHSFWFN